MEMGDVLKIQEPDQGEQPNALWCFSGIQLIKAFLVL